MRILVVEDEHGIANAIKKGLMQEQYVVDVAYDGQVGCDMGSDDIYDVIILDLMLPTMDGNQVCSALRGLKIHTPIIMLTARDSVKDKVKSLNTGADDYLPKPFAFEELLARVNAVARRSKIIEEDITKVRELSIDNKKHKVTRQKIEIPLSSKEYSLLEYLVRQSPNVVSKDQIIEHVWDYDSDVLVNTVEVYVKKLRAKIDTPFHELKPLIQTLRGFGYKVE